MVRKALALLALTMLPLQAAHAEYLGQFGDWVLSRRDGSCIMEQRFINGVEVGIFSIPGNSNSLYIALMNSAWSSLKEGDHKVIQTKIGKASFDITAVVENGLSGRPYVTLSLPRDATLSTIGSGKTISFDVQGSRIVSFGNRSWLAVDTFSRCEIHSRNPDPFAPK